MPFFSSSSPFDDDVEKATAANNTTEDWSRIMDICDQIPRSPSGPKDALKSIMKRVNHRIPQVSLQALTLLDACVNNCGKVFHLEICSRDFVGEVRNSLARVHPTAALKFKGMIRDWAKTFKDDPQLNLIPTLYEELKREKVEFPDDKTKSGISLSSSLSKPTNNPNEDDDLALAIQLSLHEAESSKPKTTSLYPSFSSGSSSSSSSNKSRKVRALYDFEAAEDNELTFKTGDIILVTDSSDANWWKGELQGKSGLFPANFVTSDLTPEPQPVKKKSKKKKKKVSFSEKNSVKEFEASKAISQPLVISEEKIEQCLEMLKNASVEDDEEDDDSLTELEETCKKMGPLVAAKLTEVQKQQDELSDLAEYFSQAMNTYQKYCQEPLPTPQSYSSISHVPKYVRNAPTNSPTVQQPYVYNNPYVPASALQYMNSTVPEAMNRPYSVQGPPGQPAYAVQVNPSQYAPQLQHVTPHQGPGATPQEYAYTAGQVSTQFPPEVQYSSQQVPATGQYQMQPNYHGAVPGPYTGDSHTQLITAQSRY